MALSHQEMTKHLRKRIKIANIPARVSLYTACGTRCIRVMREKHDAVWTAEQAREICLIASVNELTGARRSPIDHTDAYWSRVPHWAGDFHFEFHGVA